MQQEIHEMLQLCISILWPQFFSKLLSVILLNYKQSNWFYFPYWQSLKSPKQIAVLSTQNIELFGEYIFRSSCPELFYEKDFLKKIAKFEKYLCQSLLFNSCGLKASNFIKKAPHYRCCPLNFARILRTCILWNPCKGLLLHIARLIST